MCLEHHGKLGNIPEEESRKLHKKTFKTDPWPKRHLLPLPVADWR